MEQAIVLISCRNEKKLIRDKKVFWIKISARTQLQNNN